MLRLNTCRIILVPEKRGKGGQCHGITAIFFQTERTNIGNPVIDTGFQTRQFQFFCKLKI